MLTRRQTLFAALATIATPALASGAPYTVKTAPDPLTRAILANPILSLDLPDEDPAPAIHDMFPQLIEQNFARLTDKGISRLLAALSADELRDLAVAYTAAAGSQGRLLDLFALRLTGQELGQLTPYFGYGPVYEAVWRSAPDKSNEFAQHAIADVLSGGPAATDISPNVGMTITQIYNTYRTAPIGGMSVKAALYETAMFAGGRLYGSYLAGHYVGTQISSLIQTHAPALHNAIGSGIHSILDAVNIASYSPATLGPAQANAALSFSLGTFSSTISQRGGDYGVCAAWAQFGGNGGGKCMTCYVELY